MNPDACSLCPHRSRPVPGQGPVPCRYAFVGEGPGRQEHAKGIPFCGESGWELDGLYLPLAGLCRSQVYVTNVCKCRQGDDNPTDAQAAYCARHHITGELREVQPEVIVTLGAVAARVLFPDCDLSLGHGLPRRAVMNPEIASWSGLHVPMYHPAVGIRDSHWMVELTEDFRRLKKILRDGWTGPVDKFPEPRYFLAESRPDHAEVVYEIFYRELGDELAIDTEVESLETMTPWCLSVSFGPGQGVVVTADNHPALEAARAGLEDSRSPFVVLHNALFDLPVLTAMGIRIPERRFVDTMSMAYHRGTPPWGLGLKTLAWRLCGMRMVEFEELVRPGSLAALQSYLQACDSKIPARDPVRRRLNRLLVDLDTGRAEDPWKRIRDWPREIRYALQKQKAVGKIPWPSIIHVDRQEAIRYAARDADATLRVYHALRQQHFNG